MANCLQCGVPFLTKISNCGREDLCCAFGCRQERKKAQARERSKKYYQTENGKDKKKKLNRNRNDNFVVAIASPSILDDKPDTKEEKIKKIGPIIIYIKILLQSATQEIIKRSEIIEVYEKVRSRSLDLYRKLNNISGYG